MVYPLQAAAKHSALYIVERREGRPFTPVKPAMALAGDTPAEMSAAALKHMLAHVEDVTTHYPDQGKRVLAILDKISHLTSYSDCEPDPLVSRQFFTLQCFMM